MRLQLQPAYLLHRRAYRDSSELLELLTAEHGRLGAVARGVTRKRSGGALGALLQPFRPLLVSLSGRGELLTVTAVEAGGDLGVLRGDGLLCGFYLNEVLLRVMQRFESHAQVFVAYGRALEELARAESADDLALALRGCELALIEELGYAIDFRETCDTASEVREGARYRLISGDGLVLDGSESSSTTESFRGEDLLAVADGRLAEANAMELKRLMRLLLASHLGPQPLRSQEMFRALRVGSRRS